jgi:hypothetical protein
MLETAQLDEFAFGAVEAEYVYVGEVRPVTAAPVTGDEIAVLDM